MSERHRTATIKLVACLGAIVNGLVLMYLPLWRLTESPLANLRWVSFIIWGAFGLVTLTSIYRRQWSVMRFNLLVMGLTVGVPVCLFILGMNFPNLLSF